MRPELLLQRLAEREEHLGEGAPPAPEADLEEGARDPGAVVAHVGHVHDEGERAGPGAADVALHQQVGLAVRALQAPPHVHLAAPPLELLQLGDLVVADPDVGELGAEGQHLEQVGARHVGLQALVVRLDGAVLDVVVTGHAAHLGDVQVAALLVEDRHPALREPPRRGGDELLAVLGQGRVPVQRVPGEPVGQGVAQHADVEVGVAQPHAGLPHVGHRAQHQLGVQVVDQLPGEGALDRGLVLHQRQVAAQLVVGRDDERLPPRVELRPARAAEDLHHVEDADLHEGPLLRVVVPANAREAGRASVSPLPPPPAPNEPPGVGRTGSL